MAQNVRGRRRAVREDAKKEGGAFAISTAPAQQRQRRGRRQKACANALEFVRSEAEVRADLHIRSALHT